VELLGSFPNAEEVALALLETAAPTVLVIPEDLVPPLIVVRRVGGADDRITDQPRIQVQTFGANYAQAADLAEQSRQLILASPARAVAGATIDQAFTDTAPAYVDYGQPSVFRFVATYRLEFRRPR
jgi:hypothetical protein